MMTRLDQAFHGFNSQMSQIYKMKTISASIDNPEPCPNSKKYPLSNELGSIKDELVKARKPLYIREQHDPKRYQEHLNSLVFNGSEIMICDLRPTLDTSTPPTSSFSAQQTSKYSHKRIQSMKLSQRKSID
jgi:hypothetical protein